MRALVTAPFVLLPNLILGEKAVPELIQEDCNARALAAALCAARRRHGRSGAPSSPRSTRVRERIAVQGKSPAARAAEIVATELRRG